MNSFQVLTTGGGWQDQIGGIFPGFKITHSDPALPLRVQVDQLFTTAIFRARLNARLLLL
jgi:fucokinase